MIIITLATARRFADVRDGVGCFRVETVKKFARCGGCGIPYFCSKECQKKDRKARHKHVCKEAKKKRDQTAAALAMLDQFSKMSQSGQAPGEQCKQQ